MGVELSNLITQYHPKPACHSGQSTTKADEQREQADRTTGCHPVALDASPASYLVHMTLADQAGITPATMKSMLAVLAPLVGSARVVAAADKVLQAIRLANRV